MQTILVTGGMGYIGAHTVVELLNANYQVIIVDNLVNSSAHVLSRIKQLTQKSPEFYQVDLLDLNKLEEIFLAHKIDGVIHFAGLKAVGESVTQPLNYYKNNISGSLNLFAMMQKYKVKTIVFSSSATVYGDPDIVPIKEDAKLDPANPYGKTKLMIEQILQDIYHADNSWNIINLRYFNPVGAHPSGIIGEDPNGIPNNLMPYISQVAVGRLEYLNIFGNDYPTHDGTGVRDYIHVVDLAIGHLKAIEYFTNHDKVFMTFNLGNGIGHSVLDVVKAYEVASGREIPYKFVARRHGDIAKCYADPTLANNLLGWLTKFTLADMCRDSWNWQSHNPNGYT